MPKSATALTVLSLDELQTVLAASIQQKKLMQCMWPRAVDRSESSLETPDLGRTVMTRLSLLKAELARLRQELEFIDGQLANERLLEMDDLAELSLNDIDNLQFVNEKLLTEVVMLETLLETAND